MQVHLLPDLQLVRLERCVLHETADPQRTARLEQRMREGGLLHSPPIVARYPEGERLLVLDGATRTTALRQLGLDAMPVQLVQYADEHIQLQSWAHLLPGTSISALVTACQQTGRVRIEPVGTDAVHPALRARALLCAWLDAHGNAYGVRNTGTLLHNAQTLELVFNSYAGRVTIQRLPDAEPLDVAEIPDDASVVMFARFAKAELLELTHAGGILPAGITRHIIPGRVLRLDAPLAALRSGSFEARQEWFTRWVAERIASGDARLYLEPTWLFND